MEAHELHSCTFSLVLTLIYTPEFDTNITKQWLL